MAQVTYQVTLAVKGNHTVSVASDDPAALTAALVWATKTHEKLVARATEKKQQDEKEEGETPICQVHNVPMVRQEGKYGPFWSCHQRNEDGSFCSYKPNGR